MGNRSPAFSGGDGRTCETVAAGRGGISPLLVLATSWAYGLIGTTSDDRYFGGDTTGDIVGAAASRQGDTTSDIWGEISVSLLRLSSDVTVSRDESVAVPAALFLVRDHLGVGMGCITGGGNMASSL